MIVDSGIRRARIVRAGDWNSHSATARAIPLVGAEPASVA